MTTPQTDVSGSYTIAELGDQILGALEATGKDLGALTVDDLAPVDFAARLCSGLTYSGVPRSDRAAVSAGRASVRAMPKSVTIARPPAVSNMTLSGFTSRCTTPRPWAWPRAQATSWSICTASPTESGPL